MLKSAPTTAGARHSESKAKPSNFIIITNYSARGGFNLVAFIVTQNFTPQDAKKWKYQPPNKNVSFHSGSKATPDSTIIFVNFHR